MYGTSTTPEKRTVARKIYRTFRARMQAERTWDEIVADFITGWSGTLALVVFHLVWFVGWLLINTDHFFGVPVFDPFPFGLLTMIVSLEAIFLSLFVLISQNRESEVSDTRSEVDFQVNLHSEYEITKLINMVSDICEKLGIEYKEDKELEGLKSAFDTEKLTKEVRREVRRTHKKRQ
jgi:uncharacterized membrane protein